MLPSPLTQNSLRTLARRRSRVGDESDDTLVSTGSGFSVEDDYISLDEGRSPFDASSLVGELGYSDIISNHNGSQEDSQRNQNDPTVLMPSSLESASFLDSKNSNDSMKNQASGVNENSSVVSKASEGAVSPKSSNLLTPSTSESGHTSASISVNSSISQVARGLLEAFDGILKAFAGIAGAALIPTLIASFILPPVMPVVGIIFAVAVSCFVGHLVFKGISRASKMPLFGVVGRIKNNNNIVRSLIKAKSKVFGSKSESRGTSMSSSVPTSMGGKSLASVNVNSPSRGNVSAPSLSNPGSLVTSKYTGSNAKVSMQHSSTHLTPLRDQRRRLFCELEDARRARRSASFVRT